MPTLTDTASAPKSEKGIVRLLRRSVWYVLPLVAIGSLLLAALLGGTGGAPDDGTGSTADDGPLVCAEANWDFGSVAQDTPKQSVEHDFVVKNRGDRAITIHRITTNCGCAVAESALGTIPPSGQTSVRMKLNVTGKPGLLSKDSIVFYDDGSGTDGEKQLRLTMHGTLTGSGLMLTMPKHIDFGTVNLTDKSEQRSRTFTICRYDASPLEIVSVEATIPGVTCVVLPDGRGDATESCTVKVVLDPKVFCLSKIPGQAIRGQVTRGRIEVRTKREGHDKRCIVPLNVAVE